ncbi:hypothetical protein ABK040_016544 [Willaertia magna]
MKTITRRNLSFLLYGLLLFTTLLFFLYFIQFYYYSNKFIQLTSLKHLPKQKIAIFLYGKEWNIFSQLFTRYYIDLFEGQDFPDVFVLFQKDDEEGQEKTSSSDKEFIKQAIQHIPNLKFIKTYTSSKEEVKEESKLNKELNSFFEEWKELLTLKNERKRIEESSSANGEALHYDLIILMRPNLLFHKVKNIKYLSSYWLTSNNNKKNDIHHTIFFPKRDVIVSNNEEYEKKSKQVEGGDNKLLSELINIHSFLFGKTESIDQYIDLINSEDFQKELKSFILASLSSSSSPITNNKRKNKEEQEQEEEEKDINLFIDLFLKSKSSSLERKVTEELAIKVIKSLKMKEGHIRGENYHSFSILLPNRKVKEEVSTNNFLIDQ